MFIRSAADEAGDILITVTDSGPGVPDQLLPRLFMPFVTSKSNGTGLGLAISRTIVEAHGVGWTTSPTSLGAPRLS